MAHLKLKVLSEKTLHNAVYPELVSYCPSMDLVAFGTVDQQVSVYRLNGQRVYGRTQKGNNLRIERIQWKPNGQLLATAWSDGVVKLISAESCKVVHQFTIDGQASGITCMGWNSNLANKTPSYANLLNILKASVSGSQVGEEALGGSSSMDLPTCLSLIDVEITLPKLSVLPRGGSSEDIFCSRSSLDTIFHPLDFKDCDVVDVMVIGTREGRIHISIYDSFFIGSFESPVLREGIPSFVVLHATNYSRPTHVLLLKNPKSDELSFVTMDLRFISSSGSYLPLLASRSTALQNLLRYIHQVQLLMLSEWKSTQELPNKFLRNINETLSNRHQCDIVQALYHSVATGHTFSSVKEWLVDEISERGLKRWEKAVLTGLENLKRIVHENMLPALERFSLILSRLSGIAKFQSTEDTVAFSSNQINLLIDSVACLHLVSSRILIQVADEIELFLSFSAWMRYEIERLVSDASSSSTNDTPEKESSIEHRKVFLYLEAIMTNNPLAVYFTELSTEEKASVFAGVNHNLLLFEKLDQEIKKQGQGLLYTKSVLHVEVLFENLSRQANAVFNQIAESEKRNVRFGRAFDIGASEPGSPMDIKLDNSDVESCSSYITFVPKSTPNSVQIIRISISTENGISLVQSIDVTNIKVENGTIKDLKFSNDDSLYLLLNQEESSKLLQIPYKFINSGLSKDAHINDATPDPFTSPFGSRQSESITISRERSEHEVTIDSHFVAEKLCVRRNGQNLSVSDQRFVLLSPDGLNYKVLRYEEDGPGKGNT